MIIIPFFADQFFWGTCVANLGIGNTVSYKLTNEFIVSELIDQISSNYQIHLENIKKISNELAKENGILNSYNFIRNNFSNAYIQPTFHPDSEFIKCSNNSCPNVFGFLIRKHHCRNCGGCFCNSCCENFLSLSKYRLIGERVCGGCIKNKTDLI